ncbi:MAG: ferritin [Bacteroidetes bacterium]|jgi:ferritin|nr:ferritin [Bacteroidota bacterium]MBT5530936.1 ferritin [Cytophagia bacterium]MBT3424081.1 ferritin [Bacteroidota bacterium]MBT3802224.1 ferritin [Bacteroidota bacterium]MBT3933797.1 ferritin [Bacteroidota bacterium]
MIKEKIENALNKQINEELYSSYLYWSMSSYFESINLSGFANWMKVQAEEEYLHARKFYNYLVSTGGRAIFESIKAPKKEWNSIVEIFEETLEHEIFITNCINDLVTLALDERDHATNSFLTWFVDEQVEEVATAEQVLHEVKMIADSKQGLFLLDREFKTRPGVIADIASN